MNKAYLAGLGLLWLGFGLNPAALATVTGDEIKVDVKGEAIGAVHTGTGDLIITKISGISKDDYDALSEQLGVTKSALKSFLKILVPKSTTSPYKSEKTSD